MSARAFAASCAALLGCLTLITGPLDDGHAQRRTLTTTRLDGLEAAPFPPVVGAPQLLVQSSDAAADGVDVVLHLHGYEGCIEVLAARGPTACRVGGRPREGWDLFGAHAESDTRSWLLLPQLAFDVRDGSAGRLARRDGARRLIEQALTAVAGERRITVPAVRSVTITAHSAGFEPTIAVLRHGGLDDVLRHVVLFDAMYSGTGTFAAWAAADPRRSLVAFHTANGTPARRAEELARTYRSRLGSRLYSGAAVREVDIAPGRVVLLRAQTGHRGVPRRYLGPTLARLLR